MMFVRVPARVNNGTSMVDGEVWLNVDRIAAFHAYGVGDFPDTIVMLSATATGAGPFDGAVIVRMPVPEFVALIESAAMRPLGIGDPG